MIKTTIVSIFEGGYQPLTAISATTALRNAGYDADMLDVYVDGIKEERLREANLIGISAPLFDALNGGVELTKTIRAINPNAKIVFFGQYATLNAGRLSGKYSDYTIMGEWEPQLPSLVKTLNGEESIGLAGVVDGKMVASGRVNHPLLTRNHIKLPDRGVAPTLSKYPQLQIERLMDGKQQVVGGVESTRGCHHKCTYCSVFAAYDGKVVLAQEDMVVEDVASLVDQGMTHLTFTDAEFFNAKYNGVRIMRRLHERFPHLTYDFTTRVDHILEQRDALEEMAILGLRIVTTALEFPTQRVLDVVNKEITVTEIEEAIHFAKSIGVTLNPTFIKFNPWVSLSDLDTFDEFLDRNDLSDVVDPIQHETRLHLYKGSPLLNRPSTASLEMEEREFHYEWKHPDPRVDELFLASVTPMEEGVFKRCCLKC